MLPTLFIHTTEQDKLSIAAKEMKSTLFALFLLCALTSYLPSATAGDVVDTDGNPVENGGTYFVLPTIILNGGGIEYATFGNETCPVTVAQSRDQFCKGFPITISSPARIRHISEGLSLNIGFTFASPCSPASEWTIVKDQPEGLAVKLTGYENKVPGWFNIERVSREYNDYKLVFCPQQAEDNKCEDIGIQIDDDGIRRLVLSKNKPLVVQFQKFRSSTA